MNSMTSIGIYSKNPKKNRARHLGQHWSIEKSRKGFEFQAPIGQMQKKGGKLDGKSSSSEDDGVDKDGEANGTNSRASNHSNNMCDGNNRCDGHINGKKPMDLLALR